MNQTIRPLLAVVLLLFATAPALATLGVGGQLDTETAKKPIIGFIFSNKGLMYNLTFEGSKITKIDK